MPLHNPPFEPPLPQRIRDVRVADAIAAEAGVDSAPELLQMSPVVSAVIPLQPRPPLALSGYFPGTIGVRSAAVALNTSHAGIFGTGFSGAITRVNWCLIMNNEAATQLYTLRRVDSPFTGFPSTAATPGYINAGNPSTGHVFSVIKSDTVGVQGVFIAQFRLEASDSLFIPGPWILSNGILVVAHGTVNKECHAAFGYETWPAVKDQPAGG